MVLDAIKARNSRQLGIIEIVSPATLVSVEKPEIVVSAALLEIEVLPIPVSALKPEIVVS